MVRTVIIEAVVPFSAEGIEADDDVVLPGPDELMRFKQISIPQPEQQEGKT